MMRGANCVFTEHKTKESEYKVICFLKRIGMKCIIFLGGRRGEL